MPQVSLAPIILKSGAQIPVIKDTITGMTFTGPIPKHLQAEYSDYVVARVRAFRELDKQASGR